MIDILADSLIGEHYSRGYALKIMLIIFSRLEHIYCFTDVLFKLPVLLKLFY